MNIEWQTYRPADKRQAHFASIDGLIVGRVMPWYLPEGRYVYVAEVHRFTAASELRVDVLGDYHTPDEAKQAVEDAVKERL